MPRGKVRVIVPLPKFGDRHLANLGWMEQSQCRNNPVPPEEFFPAGKTGKAHRNEVKRVVAKACSNCEVQIDCLLYSQSVGATEGIWGGIDLAETRSYDLRTLLKRVRENQNGR